MERLSFFAKITKFLDEGAVVDVICLYWMSGNEYQDMNSQNWKTGDQHK